jgi:hypothetical protein
MIEQELHLIEDRGRARVGDPSLGADIGDSLSLAGPSEPPPLFLEVNLVAGHQ